MADGLPRVSAVMVDTVDLDVAVAFWTEFLGLEVVQRTDWYAYLSPLMAGGPHLAFQLVTEPKTTKSRQHLDIRVEDLAAAAGWVEAHGGRQIGSKQDPGFPKWLVMQDPLGNEFCIYDGSM